MPRYIVNRRSKIYHDTFYLTERCNTDDTRSYASVRVDRLSEAGTAVFIMCRHCGKQKERETTA